MFNKNNHLPITRLNVLVFQEEKKSENYLDILSLIYKIFF